MLVVFRAEQLENCGEIFETEDLETSEEENECETQDQLKENNDSNNADETLNVSIGKKRRFDDFDLLLLPLPLPQVRVCGSCKT